MPRPRTRRVLALTGLLLTVGACLISLFPNKQLRPKTALVLGPLAPRSGAQAQHNVPIALPSARLASLGSSTPSNTKVTPQFLLDVGASAVRALASRPTGEEQVEKALLRQYQAKYADFYQRERISPEQQTVFEALNYTRDTGMLLAVSDTPMETVEQVQEAARKIAKLDSESRKRVSAELGPQFDAKHIHQVTAEVHSAKD